MRNVNLFLGGKKKDETNQNYSNMANVRLGTYAVTSCFLIVVYP